MTLDEILLEAMPTSYQTLELNQGTIDIDINKQAREKAKEAIKQWATELVGEDEPNNYHGASSRNALRSELKQKIQEAE